MAVLIEGISVVVKCSAIMRKYVGGSEKFIATIPNDSLCSDGELASVSFLTPDDVKDFVDQLQQRGLIYRTPGGSLDLVVVDQLTGPCAPCDWVVYGHTDWNNDPDKPVAICAANTKPQKVTTPNGWRYESSLTAKPGFHEK